MTTTTKTTTRTPVTTVDGEHAGHVFRIGNKWAHDRDDSRQFDTVGQAIGALLDKFVFDDGGAV